METHQPSGSCLGIEYPFYQEVLSGRADQLAATSPYLFLMSFHPAAAFLYPREPAPALHALGGVPGLHEKCACLLQQILRIVRFISIVYPQNDKS